MSTLPNLSSRGHPASEMSAGAKCHPLAPKKVVFLSVKKRPQILAQDVPIAQLAPTYQNCQNETRTQFTTKAAHNPTPIHLRTRRFRIRRFIAPHYPPLRTIANTAAPSGSGRLGHASMVACRSGDSACFGGCCVPTHFGKNVNRHRQTCESIGGGCCR